MTLDWHDDRTSRLITELVAVEPALAPVLEQHLATYEELLPHVFMGDVTRWLTAHGPQPRMLDVLDEAIASESADLRGLVYMSFLENLEPGEPLDDRIITRLPPRLRTALMVVRGERG